LEAALAEKVEDLRTMVLRRSLESGRLDVTLPGRPVGGGRLHPSTQILRKMMHVFSEMGFQVYRSREVETDEFNFQLLNFPPHHPAREMQDSFYLADSDPDNPLVLRTQTSPGQIHYMRLLSSSNPKDPPPVRVIVPGMVFRYEQTDATHEVQFHQLEGLAVGQNITFSDLKGTLSDFARRMFGQGVRTRFRPSYFPFTEPSADLDVECFICGGQGCPVCKSSGWLEILGCGMVHPTVLRNGDYDPLEYTGFAFGMGAERVAMLYHRVQDIRSFWANEMRFLEQF
jgi:phenylalanyl-tRNA synthetase alpha chain